MSWLSLSLRSWRPFCKYLLTKQLEVNAKPSFQGSFFFSFSKCTFICLYSSVTIIINCCVSYVICCIYYVIRHYCLPFLIIQRRWCPNSDDSQKRWWHHLWSFSAAASSIVISLFFSINVHSFLFYYTDFFIST